MKIYVNPKSSCEPVAASALPVCSLEVRSDEMLHWLYWQRNCCLRHDDECNQGRPQVGGLSQDEDTAVLVGSAAQSIGESKWCKTQGGARYIQYIKACVH